jgi:hypothetical protein
MVFRSIARHHFRFRSRSAKVWENSPQRGTVKANFPNPWGLKIERQAIKLSLVERMILGSSMSSNELFSPAEIGAVAGIPVRAVYKVIEQRLPVGFVIRRNRQPLLTRWGAICVLIDHEMPKGVPVTVRKQAYAQIKGSKPYHRSNASMGSCTMSSM